MLVESPSLRMAGDKNACLALLGCSYATRRSSSDQIQSWYASSTPLQRYLSGELGMDRQVLGINFCRGNAVYGTDLARRLIVRTTKVSLWRMAARA